MTYVIMVLLLVAVFIIFSFARRASITRTEKGTKNESSFVIATHYYGLKSNSWPVNYLNTVHSDEIKEDVTYIKEMGFNTIILLVSWAEFEPVEGVANSKAYQKLLAIIDEAEQQNVKVLLRVPYLWSLAADGRERLIFALLDIDNYQRKLVNFIHKLERKITKQHTNLAGKFGSWEDFYILRDLFFTESTLPLTQVIHQRFLADTGLNAKDVIKNGDNYQFFYQWLDTKIEHLAKAIDFYGYEIRTDAELQLIDNTPNWIYHSDFFQNKANGQLLAYWAPFYGGVNQGEKIKAEQALSSFNWMLDLIAKQTVELPLINQLNFFDNTPGTSLHAQIDTSEINLFFEGLATVLINKTSGYGLWTLKDYSHNIVYNSSFSNGLSGWLYTTEVYQDNSGVVIPFGQQLSQALPPERMLLLMTEFISIIIEVISGHGYLSIAAHSQVLKTGINTLKISLAELAHGAQLEITAINCRTEKEDNLPLVIKYVMVNGHKQIGHVLDSNADKAQFYQTIVDLNRKLAILDRFSVKGFSWHKNLSVYTAGVHSDNWTDEFFAFCGVITEHISALQLEVHNPVTEQRLTVLNENMKQEFVLLSGYNLIQLRNVKFDKSNTLKFKVSNLYHPPVPDKRLLGVNIQAIKPVSC